ncbi:MAG TPA: hypothetical protein VLX56_07320 [Nitrososphaerales archaeon]|nr:hypothetical protein [Nitrososphaerales archaeon]
MGTDLYKLIGAIDRVGIQNISLLSRMTGMPIETIRYTVRKRFPNLGLKVSLTLNERMIGLERTFVVLTLSESARQSMAAIMRGLSKEAFLTYWSKAALDNRVIALFSVPVSLADQFSAFMGRLVEGGVLESFEVRRLGWTRHPELKGRYYGFSSGEWKIDWSKLAAHEEAPPAPLKEEDVPAKPEIDSIDTLIIKEMELDAWRNIAEIARKLRINERTARWHYTKHVSRMANTNYVHWFPASPTDVSRAVGAVYEFDAMSRAQVSKLRSLFNNFPFAWFEGGSNAGYYQVHLGMPASEFMEASRYLSDRLPQVVQKWNTYPLDMASERWYTIPYENFEDKKGWVFNDERALRAVLPERVPIKK